MVRPKNRRERRQRNVIAKDLHTQKYHQRVIEPYKREKFRYGDHEEDETFSGPLGEPRHDGFDDPFAVDEYD